MPERVLVTGAAGFLGANLVRVLLDRGAEVHVVLRAGTDPWRLAAIRSRLQVRILDLADPDFVEWVGHIRPQVLFDMAVERKTTTAVEQLSAWQNGTHATLNLVRAAAEAGVEAIVHLGSSLEYGPHRRPLSEKTLLEPATFFGLLKSATTLLWQQAARGQRLPVVILRPFSVYGPWEGRERLIPTAIAAALTGRSMQLTAPGIRRDFVFVEDVVRACLLAAQSPHVRGEVFNIGSGRQRTNEAIVKAVGVACNVSIPVEVGVFPARETDTRFWVADRRKADRLLGWRPRVSLRIGLEQFVDWVRGHPEYLSLTAVEGQPG